jgi:hypothetical protein
MSKAAELAALIGSQTALSNRRININGNFFIWQRGTSAITVSGDDDFTCDRFKGWANGGGTFTVEQSTDVPSNEFEFSAKLINTGTDTSVAAGDDYRWATDIEGYDVARLAYGTSDAKTATLSFWVKSSLTGTYCGAFYSTTASRHYIYEYTISSANTWEKKTITVEGDTTGSWNRTNGNGLRIYWGFGSGSDVQGTADVWAAGEKWETTNQAAWIGSASATFFITGVQLEVGSGPATPFEHEDFGTTLIKCKRYYEHSYAYGTSAGTATTNGMSGGGITAVANAGHAVRHRIRFDQVKCKAPTMTAFDSAGNSGKCNMPDTSTNVGQNFFDITTISFTAENNGVTSTDSRHYLHYVADAEL